MVGWVNFARECLDIEVTCFNYSEKGHISMSFLLPRRERAGGSLSAQFRRSRTVGKVFELSSAEATDNDCRIISN